MVQPPGVELSLASFGTVTASEAEAVLRPPPPAAAGGWKDLEEGRRGSRRGGEERAAPSISPGGVEGWRGVRGSPPPLDIRPVQGETTLPGVRGARVTGQAMSLRGTEINQCGAAAGLLGLPSTLSHSGSLLGVPLPPSTGGVRWASSLLLFTRPV